MSNLIAGHGGNGGEIGWKCLSNGKYVFTLSIYEGCSGIPMAFSSRSIMIQGSPLPTDSNNQTINSISVLPDSSKWVANNYGLPSNKCNVIALPGRCTGFPPGTYRQYFFSSEPIELNGIPPRFGWDFTLQNGCCKWSYENINAGSNSLILRATMFSSSTRDSVNQCFDSTPKFIESPQGTICEGQASTYSVKANDKESDSLVYSWAKSIASPYTYPTSNFISYVSGFSATNPTPDASFDSLNVASNLNRETGIIKLLVNSGFGNYSKVIRVDNWRNGKIISSIYREFSMYVNGSCPSLPNATKNNPPQAIIDSTVNPINYSLTVPAGQLVNLPIVFNDSDSVMNQAQKITLTASGVFFSTDLATDTNCLDSNKIPCAVFKNSTPSLDTSFTPNKYSIVDSGAINTIFSWQTSCNLLDSLGGAKTFYFYLKAEDDFCPINANNLLSIAITVTPDSCFGLSTNFKQEMFETDNIGLYPNPNEGQFKLRLNNKFKAGELKMYNLQGQVLKSERYLQQKSLDLEIDGEPGIYFIQLTNSKGERANLKVVKQ